MAFLTQFNAPSDGLLFQQDKTEALVNDRCLGEGCIYITKNQVLWLNGSSCGFSMEYPKISLHATCRDASSFPKPCLYVMFDGCLDGAEVEQDEDDDDEEEDKITEIRFVPDDASSLDAMYQALSDGNVLHPDPDDSPPEDDDEDYTPETGGNGFFRVGKEGEQDENEETTTDASQFENADEEVEEEADKEEPMLS